MVGRGGGEKEEMRGQTLGLFGSECKGYGRFWQIFKQKPTRLFVYVHFPLGEGLHSLHTELTKVLNKNWTDRIKSIKNQLILSKTEKTKILKSIDWCYSTSQLMLQYQSIDT